MENELLEIIAIDESGISALRGYSVYTFVFILKSNSSKISEYIVRFEKEAGLDYIHRQEMSWKMRYKLAKKLSLLEFEIRAVAYENPILPDKSFERSLIYLITKINNTHQIIIDGKKNKQYKT